MDMTDEIEQAAETVLAHIVREDRENEERAKVLRTSLREIASDVGYC